METDGDKASQIVAEARLWIGTPYVHQASTKGHGCDCLGLLRGVWREVTGEDPEKPPPYTQDWAEATGRETLFEALSRHMAQIPLTDLRPGDVVLFRMVGRGPAKHCGIVAEKNDKPSLIHARQNKQVSEEWFSPAWQRKAAFAFRV